MTDEIYTDEWLDANHRLLQVWTQQTQRWMAQMMTGDATRMDRPPMFEDLMGLSGKLVNLGESIADLMQETWHYQSFFMPAWYQVWQRYVLDPKASLSENGSFDTAMNTWFDYANAELLQLQSSEEYLHVSQQLGQAISRFKICQRKVSDYMLSRLDMPTQAELDSLGRTVFDLKREMRRLKEQIRKLKEQQAANDDIPSSKITDNQISALKEKHAS